MPDTNYSTDPNYSALDGPRGKQVPFRVYAEIFPTQGTGRRWEQIRSWNQWAADVQEDLRQAGINIALPVAFTPQFAQAPARVTLHGFFEVGQSGDIGKPPTTDVTVASSNQFKTGNKGGSLSRRQDPLPEVNAEVLDLKTTIEGLIDPAVVIFKIEYSSIIYGKGGRSFPS